MAFDYTNYYLLEYLESSGTQYINIGKKCGQDFEIKMQLLRTTSHSYGMFGVAYNGWWCAYTNYNKIGFLIGKTTFSYQVNMDTDVHTFKLVGTTFTDNGVSQTISTGTAYNDVDCWIFGTNGLSYKEPMRLYYALFPDASYYPAERKSDGVLGLYDADNGIFLTNNGTGTFTAGPRMWNVNVWTSGHGYVNGGGTYPNGSTATISAVASTGYVFAGWYRNNVYISNNNPYSFTVYDNVELYARFVVSYNITLTYDNTLGSASYSWAGSNVVLSATPNADAQFKGWYKNSVLLSTNNPYTYTPTGDTTIECRFEQVYTVTTSVSGNGSVSYTRGVDRNDIEVSVIADANNHFVKYTVNGTDYTTTPLNLHLTQNTTIVAYFEQDTSYHISASTNFDYGSIYISDNDVYSGTLVTLWARPFPDYVFVEWSDGVTSNPRQITVASNITLVAKYHRVTDTNGIYQYRCYIKDQLDLEALPKAFLRVDTFDIRTDLLTNATSSITVLEMLSDVDEGDVLVLYDPKGTTLYTGVITAIEDKTIECSQMQSFYRGTWIYDTSPQTYLEEEIADILQDYADGKMKGSTYVDGLIAQRLGGITIDYTGSTTVSLPTTYEEKSDSTEYETLDMEEFIYELYRKYGIIFDFEINISGTNYVHIKVPSYTKIKVGNNMFAISNMSPVTEIEETNKLVIYGSDNTYRTTYVATKTGIVEEPSTTANRFNITNTSVVFSDDPVEDLVASELPQTMYNHHLSFTLLIKNFIYQFGDFNLGGELDVYFNDEYYNSVLTGYEISKSSNQNISSVDFVCGIVRKKLTQLLTMGKV